MARKKRTQYSETQRRQVLETAVKERLTAAQVHKKFGVTPVTYYSWRKKYGAARRRGAGGGAVRAIVAARAVGMNGGDPIGQQVRSAVRARVQAMVQDVVRAEVAAYVDSLFGRGPGRPPGVARRRRRRRRTR
jgi:transposase-like protein